VSYATLVLAGKTETPKNIQLVEGNELAIVGGCSILPISSPDIPVIDSLGYLRGDNTEVVSLVISQIGVNNEILKIMDCESNFIPTVKNPSSTAYGLCQFTNGTWNYVQKKWGMKLIRENIKDQIYACNRLWEEEGTRHWEESRFCWELK